MKAWFKAVKAIEANTSPRPQGLTTCQPRRLRCRKYTHAWAALPIAPSRKSPAQKNSQLGCGTHTLLTIPFGERKGGTRWCQASKRVTYFVNLPCLCSHCPVLDEWCCYPISAGPTLARDRHGLACAKNEIGSRANFQAKGCARSSAVCTQDWEST